MAEVSGPCSGRLEQGSIFIFIDLSTAYLIGDASARNAIIDKLHELITFYPGHIIKEDKKFFPDTEKYFTAAELDHMLDEFF